MPDLAELGRFLKAHREQRGLSREELARTTRIAPALIIALEEGRADRLPAQVFVQNCVRSYARAVGLREEDAVDRLLAIPGMLPPTEQSPARLETSRRTHAYKVLVVLGLIAVAFALWWWGYSPRP